MFLPQIVVRRLRPAETVPRGDDRMRLSQVLSMFFKQAQEVMNMGYVKIRPVSFSRAFLQLTVDEVQELSVGSGGEPKYLIQGIEGILEHRVKVQTLPVIKVQERSCLFHPSSGKAVVWNSRSRCM